MKKPSVFPTRLKTAVGLFAILSLAAAIGLAVYGIYLAHEIESRFSGRRWQIPSRVFADSTYIYPGEGLDPALFIPLLQRLGYREVKASPKAPGEFKNTPNRLTVFFKALDLPGRKRGALRVQIDLDEKRIRALTRLDDNTAMPLVEIEGEELMRFYGPQREQRRLISIHAVPEHMIEALLAAEDNRFYAHHGLDLKGLLRAAAYNLRHGTLSQGGSTITQQLAKNYFLTPERTFSRKFKELCLALTLEAMYTKDEILEIYLNEIYFGQMGAIAINGIGEAALFYFQKAPEDLSLPEAATLAGLIRGPNLYSPYKNIERCRQRRDRVLQAMYELAFIDRGQLDQALATDITVAGYTAYHRQAPYFMDFVTSQLKVLYSPEDLTGLGMSIYTTLDSQVQKAAENALSKGLERLESTIPAIRRKSPQDRLQGAVVVIQPKTGCILAMVGGRDYALSQFNRITQAKRQPGSVFKPLVFLCALDQYAPASLVDTRLEKEMPEDPGWHPQNYAEVPEARIRMREALAHSINTATVNLALDCGLERITALATQFGFTTDLRPLPSLALGAMEVIPLEAARSYCPFAASGVLPFLLSVREITDENGVVRQQRNMAVQQVTTPAKAFLINSMLRSVVQEGTAKNLKKLGISFPVAAKTGTTNDFRDAWFVGYTPDILALVWVGFDDGSPVQASGARAAMPIWAELIEALPQYEAGTWFTPPPGVVDLTVCAQSGQIAGPSCPETLRDFFLEQTAPQTICSLHAASNPFKRIWDKARRIFQRD